jgi:hypothetical protein
MITISTYQELSEFVDRFAKGYLPMLVICSRGGLGKSEEARSRLDRTRVVEIGGHVTPLKLFELLYEGRDKPVYFDEIDELLGNPQHVGLLKQLCETRHRKRVMWASTDRRVLEITGGNTHFVTRSKVLMLCNSFDAFNANAAAFMTRALPVRFMPGCNEVLAKIESFAKDPEVVEFLRQFHGALRTFNLRTYGRLEHLKNADLDWQRYALQETDTHPKVREIADLLERFNTDLERLEQYPGSRRDYYNWKPEAVAYLQRRTIARTASKEPRP